MLEINQAIKFDEINKIAYASESLVSKNLLDYLKPEYNKRIANIEDRASEIVDTVRKSIKSDSPIENLLQEYELNTKEGTVLLCLAEALLRIPDKKTIITDNSEKASKANVTFSGEINNGICINCSQ